MLKERGEKETKLASSGRRKREEKKRIKWGREGWKKQEKKS